jgi:hypothetical protein
MDWLIDIWEMPINLLAWIIFHLIVLTNGKIKWINEIAIWLDLSDKIIIKLLDK